MCKALVMICYGLVAKKQYNKHRYLLGRGDLRSSTVYSDHTLITCDCHHFFMLINGVILPEQNRPFIFSV